MAKKNRFVSSIIIFFKGLLMGSADIVPGVSGGTIALITGIYTRLVDGISNFFKVLNFESLKAFATFDKKKIKYIIRSIDFALFIPLFLGIATAFLSLANLIHYLMEEATVKTYAFFFGLILGSAVFLYKKLKHIDLNTILFAIIGFLISFLVTGFTGVSANHSFPVIFGSGAIAITAMILPGISGSFMLVLLNQYEYVIGAIKDLNIGIIFVFALGAFFGLLAFTRLLKYLLHSKENLTMGFLIGLMLGSLRLQYTIISENQMTTPVFIWMIVVGIIGFSIVFLLDLFGKRYEEKT
ncbi:MAG: DUF368 domain-containing protein [Candidatus Woesearchaeota archaeon]